MAEFTQLPYIVKNKTVVSAGGLDIKVVGNTITFTIAPSNNWEMSVAELESMLESHVQVVKALQLTVNLLDDGYVDADVSPTIALAKEALRRSDLV